MKKFDLEKEDNEDVEEITLEEVEKDKHVEKDEHKEKKEINIEKTVNID